MAGRFGSRDIVDASSLALKCARNSSVAFLSSFDGNETLGRAKVVAAAVPVVEDGV